MLREPVIQRTFKGQYWQIRGFFSYVPRRESFICDFRFRHGKLTISIPIIVGVGFRHVVCTPIEEERNVLLICFSNSRRNLSLLSVSSFFVFFLPG